MKTIMKNLKILKISFYAFLFLAGIVLASCSQSKKEGTDSVHEEAEGDHHSEAEGAHSGHSESSTMTDGNSTIWSPKGNGIELINNDFHFVTGAIEDITPEVVQNEAGENVLKMTANGNPAAFAFHKSYGNIGMAAMVNSTSFKGSVKLIHHAQNDTNYEFVSINGTTMKLGRVVNGDVKVFDEKPFASSDWVNLRVSAAGSHFKGYIGSKTITHGHGDKMKDGYVGIMVEGTGVLQIKSIELVPMEDE